MERISTGDTSEVAGQLAGSVPPLVVGAGRPASTTHLASRPATSDVSPAEIDQDTWCVRQCVWRDMLAYISKDVCHRKSLYQIFPDDTSEVAGWLAESVELAGPPSPTTRVGTDPASRPATSEVS